MSPRLVLLALALLLARPAVSRRGEPRSIDLAAGSIENGLLEPHSKEDLHLHLHHPHEAFDKPTKFDLDVSQYTETDDETLLELERRGGTTSTTTTTAATPTTTTKEPEDVPKATSPEDEEERKRTTAAAGTKCGNGTISVKCIEKRLESFLRTVSSAETLNVSESVQIVKKTGPEDNQPRRRLSVSESYSNSGSNGSRTTTTTTSLVGAIQRFARDHVVQIKLTKDLFSAAPRGARLFFGGPFGLKKLLLPVFIAVQIVKSILIALFLPSIIGSLGKIVGKGVSSFAQSSHNLPGQTGTEENYEFKDNNADLYNDDYMQRQPLGTLPASAMYDETMLQQSGSQQQSTTVTKAPEIASRFAFVDARLGHMNGLTDRYYTRHVVNPQQKRQDFKVFHEIPTSSLLLTNYDPFYSPVLSRLDVVFYRLGYNTEGCREFGVCAMYRSPARYAPYSNLVSTQLSRELNELRKPSSDNADVLRFFRYMKAAKDGQDGVRCEDAYAECEQARDQEQIRQNQAMLATYQDIDKLVHARKL